MTTARILTVALLALALAPAAQAQGEDERVYRKLTLDNGLRVVLASDPSVNDSAASMAVGIGANADPEDAQGLAHFLEHMLFLANEKYPELNAYGKFLKARGGFSNAYTAQDLTNYHFQVGHDALPEALDRFSQFFVSPTLDYTYAKREVAAVNSEHQKNTMDDTWRIMQLRRTHFRKDHPANAFSTGNEKTLADAKEEALRGFFNDYYKPSNMTFAVLSKRSLDDLEALVRERFNGIKTGNAKPWTCSADLMEEVNGLRVLKVAPVKDMRQLRIHFDVPLQHAHALTKIGSVVGMSMGDEGKGSLLSHLKGLGLANSLSAGIGGNRFYSDGSVTIGLTPKGLTEWKTVVELCFAYVNMLKTTEFPRYLWEESKTMAQLSEKYSPKPEGTDAAISLANNTLSHGLDVAERVRTTYNDPDPKTYKTLVDSLSPQNAIVFLIGKGLETDAKETYYGTDYSFSVDEGEFFKTLVNAKLPEGIHLPAPNPFVPKETKLHAEQPVLLRKDAQATIYYAQDTEFRRPKVSISLHILSPKAYDSPRSAALTRLYAAMLKEQLNEFSYPALVAGLGYSLSPTRKGLMLTVSGYSGSALKLLDMVAGAMRGELDPAAFERLRQQSLDGVKNFPLGQAYSYVTELTRKLALKVHISPEDTLPTLESAKLGELKEHVIQLLAATHIQGLVAGNITAADALAAVSKVEFELASKPFDPAKAYEPEVLVLKEGEEVFLKQVGATDQNCMRLDYQVGASDVKSRVAAEAFARAVSNTFYTEMRTKQKLGYIVFSGSFNRKNVQQLVFIIQSGTHAPADLQQRADACVATLPSVFDAMEPAQFEAIRASLIQDREKKIKSIAQKAGLFFSSAFDKEADFDWLAKEIAAIKALKQDDVSALLKKTVASKTRVVYHLASKTLAKFDTAGSVTDLGAFTKAHTYSAEKAGR